MISQEEAADALRLELARSSVWRELFDDGRPRVLPPGRDRIVEVGVFDIEEWITVAPGGVYEFWFSERGEARRTFRTDDLRAIMVHLVQRGLASQAKLTMRRPLFESPPGFRLSDSKEGAITVEWADHGWAEFLGPRVLHQALTFAWLMLADPDDVAASARSADGAPLMERGVLPDALGPTGVPTVESWKTWLAEREGPRDV
ncbi:MULTISPECIES: hypothetical protein [Microbacterium]|uniref:hypothetical protein n=1 Tax=Microbacterium TaxID=33882 RepID=UPI000D650635|nr:MULTISPECIES: hypothetical protein [Microbacterium]